MIFSCDPHRAEEDLAHPYVMLGLTQRVENKTICQFPNIILYIFFRSVCLHTGRTISSSYIVFHILKRVDYWYKMFGVQSLRILLISIIVICSNSLSQTSVYNILLYLLWFPADCLLVSIIFTNFIYWLDVVFRKV